MEYIGLKACHEDFPFLVQSSSSYDAYLSGISQDKITMDTLISHTHRIYNLNSSYHVSIKE